MFDGGGTSAGESGADGGKGAEVVTPGGGAYLKKTGMRIERRDLRRLANIELSDKSGSQIYDG